MDVMTKEEILRLGKSGVKKQVKRNYNCVNAEDYGGCSHCDSFDTCDININCTRCVDCYYCKELVDAHYCVLNVQLTESEYREFMSR